MQGHPGPAQRFPVIAHIRGPILAPGCRQFLPAGSGDSGDKHNGGAGTRAEGTPGGRICGGPKLKGKRGEGTWPKGDAKVVGGQIKFWGRGQLLITHYELIIISQS